MDHRFLNAFIDPAPFKLLGRSLYPWSLKYRVRLMAFKSPLITGDRGITPADLIFACQVCAEQPLGHLGLMDKMRILHLNRNPAKFEALLKAFSGYALIHDWPKFWEQDGKKSGGDNGCPWPLAIVANLIASGIEEKRAWEMPECQAVWLNSVFAMRKGAELKIMTPDEEAFMAAEEAAAASTSAKEKTD